MEESELLSQQQAHKSSGGHGGRFKGLVSMGG